MFFIDYTGVSLIKTVTASCIVSQRQEILDEMMGPFIKFKVKGVGVSR